jgi:hypothetical protein
MRLALGVTFPTPRLRGKPWFMQHALWANALALEAVVLWQATRSPIARVPSIEVVG